MREHQPGSPAPIDDGSPLEFVLGPLETLIRSISCPGTRYTYRDCGWSIDADLILDGIFEKLLSASNVIFCAIDKFILKT